MEQFKKLMHFIEENHPELTGSGFFHAANIGKLEVTTPFDLGSGLFLRRAEPHEVETLQVLVHWARPFLPLMPSRNPYETSYESIRLDATTCQNVVTPLPDDQWRYHLITFQGSNGPVYDFADVSILTTTRLKLGPAVMSAGAGYPLSLTGSTGLARVWDESELSEEAILTLRHDQLAEWALMHRRVTEMPEHWGAIKTAITRFCQLDAIPRSSPLRFLGYMTILESLLTHQPKMSDPYDSLTRQVRQKMLLIGRRCQLPLRYDMFRNSVAEGTIWNKLYAYRSAVAHGGHADFSGDLQCLTSADAALEFASSAVRTVMRQVFEEPELMADLQNC